MQPLEDELETARALSVSDLADAIETIGFECTRCGACCKATECGGDESDTSGDPSCDDTHEKTTEPHTATVFPDEIRTIQQRGEYDWRDIARPMPYGLTEVTGESTGETFEWALQTDDCGDCTFYEEDEGVGACTVHDDRPLICRTYPFSIALGGTTQPMGEAVDTEGMVRAHECEGLGRDISRSEATELASALKKRAVRELEEAIAVRENYEPLSSDSNTVVVHDSEGPKQPDGKPL